jgi:hypothetical protein
MRRLISDHESSIMPKLRLCRVIKRAIVARKRAQRPHDDTTLRAAGFGVTVELEGNRLKISKGGVIGLLEALLGFEGSFAERTLRVDQIAAIEVDRPILFFRYIRISYPGSPQMTGNDQRDSMAENAIPMSFFDNRPFYRIIERIEEMMEAKG